MWCLAVLHSQSDKLEVQLGPVSPNVTTVVDDGRAVWLRLYVS